MKDNKILIQNPCPMVLNRMKNDSGYYCSSCSKSILDFRNKTNEEIKESITEDSCGIYTSDQVSTPTFNFSYKLAFRALTILSFIGFNVKPLHAQDTIQTPKSIDSLHQNPSQTGIILSPTFQDTNRKAPENEEQKEVVKRKKTWFRRNKKSVLMGKVLNSESF